MLYFFPCDPYDNTIVSIKQHARMRNNMFGGQLIVGPKTEGEPWRRPNPGKVKGLVYHNRWLAPYRGDEGHYLFRKLRRSFKQTEDTNILQSLQNIIKRERGQLVKALMRLDIPPSGWRSPRLQLGGPSAWKIIREALRAGLFMDIKRLRYPPYRDNYIHSQDTGPDTTTRACIGITSTGKIRINSKNASNMDVELPAYELIDKFKAINND